MNSIKNPHEVNLHEVHPHEVHPPLTSDLSLAEQSQALRQQLQTQRKLIAYQLGSGPVTDNSYPRSMTMRFLTRRPAFVASLVTELATLLIGARLLKSINTAMSVARLVRSSTNHQA